MFPQLIMGAVSAGVVTVSGETISDSQAAPGSSQAGVRFNSDGTVDQNVGGIYTQIDSLTDWIIPNSLASGAYEVRATLNSGTTPTGGESTNTWLSLSSNREWFHTRDGSTEGVGSDTANLTIEIRFGATVRDSGVYDITATVT